MTELRCPKCQTMKVRYRLRTNSFICDRCGATWPKVANGIGVKVADTSAQGKGTK